MNPREQFRNAYGIELTGNKHLEILVFLMCIEFVLAFSSLGFIQIAPISLTTLSFFVIVAAMYFGPADAIVISLIFALTSMWKASLTSVEEGDIIFSPILSGKPLESLIMAVGVRIVFALVAGLLFRWYFSKERKHRKLGISVIALFATAVHAGLIYICMLVFFNAADVQTGTDFGHSLMVSNIILYAATVLVVIGCDALMRSNAVDRFFEVISAENIVIPGSQKRVTILLSVLLMLICIFLCAHFATRFIGNILGYGINLEDAYLSKTYALLLQLILGFVAMFGLIAMVFRWMQEYFAVITAESRREKSISEEFAQNNARFFALEDDFESLYDVEFESGHYVSFVKGDFYETNVYDKLVEPTEFFEDLRANVALVVHEEDREGMLEFLNRESVTAILAENERGEHFYRIKTEEGPIWFKIRIVYKNAEKKNIIVGVFNAEEEVEAKEQEAELLRIKELELRHAEFRESALTALVENEGDMVSYLDFFAGRLRELVGCDQVIYRDSKGTMFINNAPELGEGYEIPIEICRNCEHYDIFSPVYASGVTEMEDTAIGVDGIPTNRKCPVKSALTRIVNLDGEADGYLAIHYILDYHEFTDYERKTLEEFTNLLSLLLSRYAARTENALLAEELELKKQIEEQKEQLEEQHFRLERALAQAKSANEAKSNFLFNMSHDIRTPMNAIRGFTTMAKKNSGDVEKVNGYLDKIDISGQQLLVLINQVLEMARIEAGKIEFREEPLNVKNEFNSMVTVLSEQADENGLNFVPSISDIGHEHVLADGARMSSIALNVAGNAMKYTPEGGTVEFSLREVESRKPGFATYIFTVSDNGIGMSEEYLKEIYEPFSRAKSSTVSKIQGTGLGLSIVKSTVDLMGGEIEVQSELGKGTRFDITLDFRIDENAGAAKGPERPVQRQSMEGRRVLLVDDNEMNREIARDILEEHGFIVEEAEDGDVAVEMVRNVVDTFGPDYYDIILMDIQMPRMNGFEATKAIRALPPHDSHIPIIAMTANAFEEDRKNALEAGMDEHLSKPVDVDKLLETLAEFI